MNKLDQLRAEAAEMPPLPALADRDADRLRRGPRPRATLVLVGELAQAGMRRIHQKPDASEIAACTGAWLEQELAVVRPQVVVCLGATAAQALLGRQFRVTKQRGTWVESDLAPHVTATVHPSSILRQRTDEERRQEMDLFVADFRRRAAR